MIAAKFRVLMALIVVTLGCTALGQNIYYSFDDLTAHSGLPIDDTISGVTAHLSATNAGFSIQQANALGFTPTGFSGNCVYPNSVFAADLQIGFSHDLNSFSIMYAPEEYACDSSATMRVTAYWNGAYVGTATTTAPVPGTWPTGTLSFSTASGRFNYVVVHYDSAPPTGGDWGPIFMADNMRISIANAPYAVADHYATAANQTLSVPATAGVLANDVDSVGATVVLVHVPTHGTLSLSQDGSFTYSPAAGYVGTDAFTYKNSLNGHVSNVANAYLSVQPPLTGVSVNLSPILGGDPGGGHVTVSIASPSGGTAVHLSSASPLVILPAYGVVPAGYLNGAFSFSTKTVSSATTVLIRAALNGAVKYASVVLQPGSPLNDFTVSPTSAVGGLNTYATVKLAAPVPMAYQTIAFASGNPSVVVPASLNIATPNSSAVFKVATLPVSAARVVTLKASYNGISKFTSLTVLLPPVNKLVLNPTSVKGGTVSVATVYLSGKAGPSGDVLTLTSGNSLVTVPLHVTVPAGATFVQFNVSTQTVSSQIQASITAKLGSSTQSAILTVTP